MNAKSTRRLATFAPLGAGAMASLFTMGCGGSVSGQSASADAGGVVISTLASGQSQISGLAVDSTSVYWTAGLQDGSVMKAPLDGGAQTTLAAGIFAPGSIAVDTTSIYWTYVRPAAA